MMINNRLDDNMLEAVIYDIESMQGDLSISDVLVVLYSEEKDMLSLLLFDSANEADEESIRLAIEENNLGDFEPYAYLGEEALGYIAEAISDDEDMFTIIDNVKDLI